MREAVEKEEKIRLLLLVPPSRSTNTDANVKMARTQPDRKHVSFIFILAVGRHCGAAPYLAEFLPSQQSHSINTVPVSTGCSNK